MNCKQFDTDLSFHEYSNRLWRYDLSVLTKQLESMTKKSFQTTLQHLPRPVSYTIGPSHPAAFSNLPRLTTKQRSSLYLYHSQNQKYPVNEQII